MRSDHGKKPDPRTVTLSLRPWCTRKSRQHHLTNIHRFTSVTPLRSLLWGGVTGDTCPQQDSSTQLTPHICCFGGGVTGDTCPEQDSSSTITRVPAPGRPSKPSEAQETSSPSICARKSHPIRVPSTIPSTCPFDLDRAIDLGHGRRSGKTRDRAFDLCSLSRSPPSTSKVSGSYQGNSAVATRPVTARRNRRGNRRLQ